MQIVIAKPRQYKKSRAAAYHTGGQQFQQRLRIKSPPVITRKADDSRQLFEAEFLVLSTKIKPDHRRNLKRLIEKLYPVDPGFIRESYAREFGTETVDNIDSPERVENFYRTLWSVGTWKHEQLLLEWWGEISGVDDPEGFARTVTAPTFDTVSRGVLLNLLTGTSSWSFVYERVRHVWQMSRKSGNIRATNIYRAKDIFKNARVPDMTKAENLNDVIHLIDYWNLGLLAVIEIDIDYYNALQHYTARLRQETGDQEQKARYFRQHQSFGRTWDKLVKGKSRYHRYIQQLTAIRVKAGTAREQFGSIIDEELTPTQMGERASGEAHVLGQCSEEMVELENSVVSSLRTISRKEQATSYMREYTGKQKKQESMFSSIVGAVSKGLGEFADSVVSVAGNPLATVKAVAKVVGKVITDSSIFLFRKFCKLAGVDAEQLIALFVKSGDALKKLVDNPSLILRFFIGALKGAFGLVKQNFGKLLMGGFLGFITGAMAKDSIQLPTTWNLKTAAGFFIQLAGITVRRLWGLAEKVIGKENISKVRRFMGHINTLFSGGRSNIMDNARGMLTRFKEQAIEKVKKWALETVIGRFITKLATMFTPVGAVIGAIRTIMSIVEVVTQWGSRIQAVTATVFNSLDKITNGKVSEASQSIYNAVAGILPVGFGFMAGIAGVGHLPRSIRDFFKSIGETLWNWTVQLFNFVAAPFKKLFNRDRRNGTAEGKENTAAAERSFRTSVRGGRHKREILSLLHTYRRTYGLRAARFQVTNRTKGEARVTLGHRSPRHIPLFAQPPVQAKLSSEHHINREALGLIYESDKPVRSNQYSEKTNNTGDPSKRVIYKNGSWANQINNVCQKTEDEKYFTGSGTSDALTEDKMDSFAKRILPANSPAERGAVAVAFKESKFYIFSQNKLSSSKQKLVEEHNAQYIETPPYSENTPYHAEALAINTLGSNIEAIATNRPVCKRCNLMLKDVCSGIDIKTNSGNYTSEWQCPDCKKNIAVSDPYPAKAFMSNTEGTTGERYIRQNGKFEHIPIAVWGNGKRKKKKLIPNSRAW